MSLGSFLFFCGQFSLRLECLWEVFFVSLGNFPLRLDVFFFSVEDFSLRIESLWQIFILELECLCKLLFSYCCAGKVQTPFLYFLLLFPKQIFLKVSDFSLEFLRQNVVITTFCPENFKLKSLTFNQQGCWKFHLLNYICNKF